MSQRHNYGDDPSQYGVLYGEGPVAVVIHGGFWRARYDLTLMDALCADLVQRGWAAWNIEYRRLGNGGGVPETLDDVVGGDRRAGRPRRRPLARGDDRPLGGRASRGLGGDPRESARGGHRGGLAGGCAGPATGARAAALGRRRRPVPRRRGHRGRLADRAPAARRPGAAHARRPRRQRPARDLRALRGGLRRDAASSSPTRTTSVTSTRPTRCGRRSPHGSDPRRSGAAGPR